MLFNDTVTIERTATDPRTGDPLPDPLTHEIPNCKVAPRSETEDWRNGNAVITGKTLLAPFGADVLATDWVYIPGDDTHWEVEGDPAPWDLHGRLFGTQVALTRRRGA